MGQQITAPLLGFDVVFFSAWKWHLLKDDLGEVCKISFQVVSCCFMFDMLETWITWIMLKPTSLCVLVWLNSIFVDRSAPLAVQPGNPEIPAGAESGCPPRVSYSRRPFTNPVGVATNDQRNVCKMGEKTDLRWVWFTRSILDGYFNPLVFWYQWEYPLTSKDFFLCRVSKIGNVYIGLSLIVIHDLLSLYCPTL